MHNHVCIYSQTYFVDSQTYHVVYLHNDFLQRCKHVDNEKLNFQFLECNILNENPKYCMISKQYIRVITFLSRYFIY